MLKQEFEKIANRTVTNEQYKMIEALYMESTMDKYEFVKSIKSLLKSIPVDYSDYPVVTVAIWNKVGSLKTPNGCYYNTVKAHLVDVSIKDGKITLKKIPNSYDCKYSYDFVDSNMIQWI